MAQHLHSNSRSAASEVVAYTLVARSFSLVGDVAHSLSLVVRVWLFLWLRVWLVLRLRVWLVKKERMALLHSQTNSESIISLVLKHCRNLLPSLSREMCTGE